MIPHCADQPAQFLGGIAAAFPFDCFDVCAPLLQRFHARHAKRLAFFGPLAAVVADLQAVVQRHDSGPARVNLSTLPAAQVDRHAARLRWRACQRMRAQPGL